jgi:hypothetical protein
MRAGGSERFMGVYSELTREDVDGTILFSADASALKERIIASLPGRGARRSSWAFLQMNTVIPRHPQAFAGERVY